MASATVFVFPYAILHESWHHGDIFYFFLQTPCCHGNSPLRTSISPHPWLFVHVSRTKGKKKEEAEKKIRNHNKLKSLQALCSLRLSGRISAESQSFEDYLKTSTRAHTHTCTQSAYSMYYMCVFVLRFFPQALPQIPLHPPLPNTERIQSPQPRQLVWKRISKAPNLSFNDSLLFAVAH